MEASEAARCWDALALGWVAWESLGMTPASLRPLEHRIQPPVLVVGAGQGLIVEHFSRRGMDVVGVDGSRAMIEEAWARRRLRLVHGWAHALPFAAEAFATVILTTGVVPVQAAGATAAIMVEAMRVSRPGALLIAGFYCPSEPARRTGEVLGYFREGGLQQERLFAIWAARRVSGADGARGDDALRDAWARQVAAWTGTELAHARGIVTSHRDVLAAIADDVEAMAVEIRLRGHDPERVLRAGLRLRLGAVTESEAMSLMAAHGVHQCAAWAEVHVATLTVAGC
jgi:hypothetical protein